jgi:hypothetical protein
MTKLATITTTCTNFAFTAANGNVYAGPGVASTLCAPTGSPSVSTPKFTNNRQFCAADKIGAGCSFGNVCVAKITTPACTLTADSPGCSSGYIEEPGGAWFTGYQDPRTCSGCTCGGATGASCGSSLAWFQGVNCGGAGGYFNDPLDYSLCLGSTYPLYSAKLQGPITPGVCPGLTTTTGMASPIGQQQLCCR